MSLRIATTIDIALGVASLALLGFAVYAVVLCVRRAWVRSRAIAARVFWVSALVQVVAVLGVPAAVVSSVAGNSEGTSQKARILAEAISEGMNCTVALVLATPTALLVWIVAVVAGGRVRPPAE